MEFKLYLLICVKYALSYVAYVRPTVGAMTKTRRQFLAAMPSLLVPMSLLADINKLKINEIGQRIIVGFRGTRETDSDVKLLKSLISDNKIGGILILKRNVQSFSQLKSLISALNNEKVGRPLIIAIDQEGGKVARVGPESGFKSWVSAGYMSNTGWSDDEIFQYYYERAQELHDVGINLNFAPVVDLNVNPLNPIIGALSRSYGRNPELVTRFSRLFIEAHRKAGVFCCLKHFPGHGSSVTDTHKEFSDVSTTWEAEEMIPYKNLIKGGYADTIMMSHVILSSFSDKSWLPTSLSRQTHMFLRNELNFDMPIVSDDLQMNAVEGLVDPIEASLLALNAGSTFILYSNYKRSQNLNDVNEVIDFISDADTKGLLDKEIFENGTRIANSFRQLLSHL